MQMMINYLLIAFRIFSKNKSYMIINALGLGISLACCIAAYLFVAFNLEFDSFHDDRKVSNIYRLQTQTRERNGNAIIHDQAPIMLAQLAADEIAGVERYTRFLSGSGSMSWKDKAFNERITFADSTFFGLFDFPLLLGNQRAWKEKNGIFINEATAKKYFGDEDPVGKLVVMNFVNEKEISAIVGGVVQDYPANNTFGTNSVFMRFENFIDIHNLKMDDWGDWRDPSTFVELTNPEDAARIAEQLDKYIARRNERRMDMVVNAYLLNPFKSDFADGYAWCWRRIGPEPLIIFSILAILILLIACFNLTNTSIALTANRLKEVGVRKTMGAERNQIATQFLIESVIIISISMMVGLGMAQFVVPIFKDMWGFPYGLSDLNGVNLFVLMITLIFVASILAGIYPAVLSSRLRPAGLLKGTFRIKGTNALTRILVTMQFALSVIVLVSGVVFIQNAAYQEQIQFGYDEDMILNVDIQGERDFELLKNAISSNPKILSVGVSDGRLGANTYPTPAKVDTSTYDIRVLGVGENYFETIGFRFSSGRSFNLDNASVEKDGLIVNKAFVEKTGLKEPIGQAVVIHNHKYYIVGVVENHIDNIYRSREPEAFAFFSSSKAVYISMVVKTEQTDLAETQKYIEQIWKELFPNRPYESQIQGEMLLERSRSMNANLKQIFLFLTILGGLLSGCGIYALASLNIAKRTKEIGIRKVLGASVGSLVNILNREFVIVLMTAAILGATGGYFAATRLLDEFYAFHTTVDLSTLIFSGLFIFLVGIFTTSATIFSAARMNPVHTLRSE